MLLSAEGFMRWIVNYYAAATLLLLLAFVGRLLMRHPAKRIALGWSSFAGLLLLAVLSTIPNYPRLQVRSTHAMSPPVMLSPQLADEPPAMKLPTTSNSEDRHSSLVKSASAMETWIASPPGWDVTATSAFLAGFACIAVWLLYGALQAARLVRSSRPATAETKKLLEHLATRRSPDLLLNSRIAYPLAVCAWSPKIVLPEKMLQDDTCDSLESILIHELAHVRSGDLWLNLLGTLLLFLLFANPVFWFWRFKLRYDQELLADAVTANHTGHHKYAEQLIALARSFNRSSGQRVLMGLSIGGRNHALARRIKMLLYQPVNPQYPGLLKWRLAAATFGVACATLLSTVAIMPSSAADEETIEADDTKQEEQRALVQPAEPEPTEIKVRLIDQDGQPIAGAEIGFNGYGEADKSPNWRLYSPVATSDNTGIAPP